MVIHTFYIVLISDCHIDFYGVRFDKQHKRSAPDTWRRCGQLPSRFQSLFRGLRSVRSRLSWRHAGRSWVALYYLCISIMWAEEWCSHMSERRRDGWRLTHSSWRGRERWRDLHLQSHGQYNISRPLTQIIVSCLPYVLILETNNNTIIWFE